MSDKENEFLIKRGMYLRGLFELKGYSVPKIAAILGISASGLNSKLSGRTRFNENDINVICDLLDMSYEEIFRKKGVRIFYLNGTESTGKNYPGNKVEVINT